MEVMQNVIRCVGNNKSKCGYCKDDEENFCSYGIVADKLTPKAYKDLLDLGWRRSGTYLYIPDQEKSCCCLYTIRLDCKEFKIKKSQRKVLTKFVKHLSSEKEIDKGKKNVKNVEPKHHNEIIAELMNSPNFELKLVKSSFDAEVFTLYKKYQISIHKDEEKDLKPSNFKRFLVETPLIFQESEESNFGSYHCQYFLSGKLVAVGFIDLLPECLSSVYFIYDPDFKHLELGKTSALVEIYLAEQRGIDYYYMGYYIDNCTKMKYKADFQPSYLLDRPSRRWVLFKDCEAKLAQSDSAFTLLDPDQLPNETLDSGDQDWEAMNQNVAILNGMEFPLGDLLFNLQDNYSKAVEEIISGYKMLPKESIKDYIFQI